MINRIRKSLRSERGFTLIEVVMAIVILAVALPPLIMVMSSVSLDSNINEISDAASYLAERELERILSLRFDAVVNEGPTSYTGNFSDYSYQITVSAPTDGLEAYCSTGTTQCKKVQIDIDHTNGANIYLTTMVTNT